MTRRLMLVHRHIRRASDGNKNLLHRCSSRSSRFWFSAVASSTEESESSSDATITTPLPNNNNNNSDDIPDLISEYSRKQPTPASLQMLLKTGRGSGDFWGSQTFHSSASSSNHNKKRSRGNYWGQHHHHLGHHQVGLATEEDRILLPMAGYLRHELPVRLSHRIQDLDQVPLMRDMEAVQAVKRIYINSFTQLSRFPAQIQTVQEERAFAKLLASLYQNHAGVLVEMARGAYQLREEMRKEQRRRKRYTNNNNTTTSLIQTTTRTNPFTDAVETTQFDHHDAVDEEFESMQVCHQFLDRFYMSRIGIRFLAGQYLALRQEGSNNSSSSSTINNNHQQQQQQKQHYIGMICQKTSPSQCVRQAASDASMMCRRTYGRCPRVEVRGRLDLTFPYIPTYLHYILLELLKNALRATMDRHRDSPIVPAVTVIIADGTENEDVVIKISDEGGGIPRSQIEKIWSYLFTTATEKVQKIFIGGGANNKIDHSNESPLAGLGYGLPISRSYCRYFGGDVDLISMEGFGTDAFVHLKRLGDSKEPVPV